MFIIRFCSLLLVATCLASPISDDEHIQYIKELHTQLDDNVKPCENFGKYACGNLKPKNEESHSMPDKSGEIVEKIIAADAQNDEEKLMKTFFLSCKKGADVKEIFEQIDALKSVKELPVKRDFTGQEIARLLGHLRTLDHSEFLSIDMVRLSQDNSIFLTVSIGSDSDDMAATLEKFGVASEESIKIVEQVNAFIQQIESLKIEYNNEADELKDVSALKEAIPNFDWDTYFTTYANIFQLNLDDFYKKTVKTQNLETLKKLVDIVKETDSKTVVSYIILRYIDIFGSIKCEKLVPFFLPLQAVKIDNPQEYFLQKLEVFNNFDKSFAEIKNQLNNPESESMSQYMKILKNGYENHEKFLSGRYLVEMFDYFEMSEDNLYTNIVNMIQAVHKDLITNAEYGKASTHSEFFRPAIKKILEMGNKRNPFLKTFINENTKLWITGLYLDDIYENRTISEKCLPFEETYLNMNYINSHAAYHIALHDYLNYVDEHKEQFKKDTEVLTAAGLNHPKLYMLTLAQQKCLEDDTKDLNDKNLLSFFKHSKEFSDTWGCAAGEEMNKICDDSTFTPNFKKSS